MTAQSMVRLTGPLAPFRDGFQAELSGKGYTDLSAANQLRVMAHLSRWLTSQELEPGDLTPDLVEKFLEARRCEGYTSWLSQRGLAPLLDHLRNLGVVAEPGPSGCSTPLDGLLESYRRYLVQERGLAASTVHHYLVVGRLFLASRSGPENLRLDGLLAGDVTRFVVRECKRSSVGSATSLVTGLRSLLRYLFLERLVSTQLAPAVPGVAGWRGASLPKAISVGEVAALLQSCDRGRAGGRRDYAILTLLVRLGLRAGEVAGLEMSHIDWRHGEIVIGGKGRRDERLPLPTDVGEALVDYLRRARPRGRSTNVFLGARAPYGALSGGAVSDVVGHACVRAGLAPIGAHRLRHTVATGMLRAGAPLSEIAQVLRHRSLANTAIYAKVDRTSLRPLAQPWRGGAA